MTREAVAMAFETLLADGDEACLAWLAERGASGPVELVEGSLDAPDAVALAHGLAELGRTAEALEVMNAVCATRLAPLTGQGAQRSWGWAQGSQTAIG
jgi:hypothetical protein